MSDALDALNVLGDRLADLAKIAGAGRATTLSPSAVQPITRDIAKTYFESVRTELSGVQNRAGLVEEIDFVIQALLGLSGEKSEKGAYLGQVAELRPYLLEATIDLMKSRGTAQLVLSRTERAILETLIAILPSSAASYEQALRDITQSAKVSWRGTGLELRETLREVMDHLAPDDKVMAAPGFQLEPRQDRPTQRQKVRFILRARRSSGAEVNVAESTLETVDASIAGLARSTYTRGSVSAHVGSSPDGIRNLKRYVDALLADLLGIAA
jgi:hypothetical protein